MHKRVVRCLSIHVSVIFVYYVETNKLSLKLFTPSGIWTLWQYSDGRIECRCDGQNLQFST